MARRNKANIEKDGRTYDKCATLILFGLGQVLDAVKNLDAGTLVNVDRILFGFTKGKVKLAQNVR